MSQEQTPDPELTNDLSVFRMLNTKLSPQDASNILRNFDPEKHSHVDRIRKARPGQLYIFYSAQAAKQRDFCVDNYGLITVPLSQLLQQTL
jgi:hypothetical protein